MTGENGQKKQKKPPPKKKDMRGACGGMSQRLFFGNSHAQVETTPLSVPGYRQVARWVMRWAVQWVVRWAVRSTSSPSLWKGRPSACAANAALGWYGGTVGRYRGWMVRSKSQAKVRNTFQNRPPVHLEHNVIVVLLDPHLEGRAVLRVCEGVGAKGVSKSMLVSN